MSTVISVRGLSKHFGELVAVDKLDMDIPEAQVYGFLGPNGCGKTTALRMMCGLMEPTAGDIEVLGLSVPRQATLVRKQLGYMTQRFSLYQDLSAEENLRFVARIQGLPRAERRDRIEELVERFELAEIRGSLAGEISGGQKRKLALAAAVVHRPPLLILDEPTSEVDPNTRRFFWDALFDMCEQGTTVLVTTHLMDEAERCHSIAVLDRGRKVADGEPGQLKHDLQVKVVELRGDGLAQARKRLQDLPAVVSVTQTGITLRVLLPADVEDLDAWLQAQLPDLMHSLSWKSGNTSIEDVFVVATGGNRAR
jgi:ABC-2 type transport system ATP-binding protein